MHLLAGQLTLLWGVNRLAPRERRWRALITESHDPRKGSGSKRSSLSNDTRDGLREGAAAESIQQVQEVCPHPLAGRACPCRWDPRFRCLMAWGSMHAWKSLHEGRVRLLECRPSGRWLRLLPATGQYREMDWDTGPDHVTLCRRHPLPCIADRSLVSRVAWARRDLPMRRPL